MSEGEGSSLDGLVNKVSFCRICSGGCGTVVSVDEDGRIATIRGDKDNELSSGYACFKGIHAGASHNAPDRILMPLARDVQGNRKELSMDAALDEITAKLGDLIARYGPECVAVFCGNGAVLHPTSFTMQRSFLAAIGSRQFFTSLTIDQSAKLVSFGRLGGWAGGMPEIGQMDIAVMFGTNPMVSHSSLGFLTADPVKRIKQEKKRGLKLVTVDPRFTETARLADLALQALPGWDPAICAALIRFLIDEQAIDADFCAHHVGTERLDRLREAVDPFELDRVEKAAGLQTGQLAQLAAMIAQRKGHACFYGATGPNMAPFSNLAQHLIDTLNVLCGSFLREGDLRTQQIVQDPFVAPVAQVIGADRPWEQEEPSRIRGAGMFYGERLSATLADEILTTGKGQIRALLVVGGDPATSIPDQAKTIEALGSLDLLVSIDPFMGPTASLADYVIPPLLQYERTDISAQIPGYPLWPGKWAQYTRPVVDPPPGSDLADDWFVLWSLAARLGLAIDYAGKQTLSQTEPPTTDDLIAIQLEDAIASFDQLKAVSHGCEFEQEPVYVQAAPEDAQTMFEVMPADIEEELNAFVVARQLEPHDATNGTFLLAVRRMRDFFNSNGIHNQTVRQRNPYNPLFMHPADLDQLAIEDGTAVAVQSDHGRISAVVKADQTMRQGVVSLAHGWGPLDAESVNSLDRGSCVNRLISADDAFEAVNAMPHMSALPVSVSRL